MTKAVLDAKHRQLLNDQIKPADNFVISDLEVLAEKINASRVDSVGYLERFGA
jgi:hypothetical protein